MPSSTGSKTRSVFVYSHKTRSCFAATTCTQGEPAFWSQQREPAFRLQQCAPAFCFRREPACTLMRDGSRSQPPRPARFSMGRAQPCILITKPTATARMDATKRALHACEECFRRLLPPLQTTRQRCGSPTAAVTQHHPQHQHQQLWVAVLQLPKAGREGARHALSGLRQPEPGCATIHQNAASTVAHRGVTKQCGEQRMG